MAPDLAGTVLLASTLWGTIALTIWMITAVIVGGGSGAVNLIVVALVSWGVVLGSLAGGAHILASFALGRVIPALPRDILAALFGWGIALGLWALLTFSGSDAAVNTTSVVVAAIGASLNFAVVRSRFRSRRRPQTADSAASADSTIPVGSPGSKNASDVITRR